MTGHHHIDCVFFDLGQTLIDERDFIKYFETRFLETLNGFGARIDEGNYRAIRDDVIRNRKIGNGSIKELVKEISRLVTPSGYDSIIIKRLMPEIEKKKTELFVLYKDVTSILKILSDKYQLGIIANQSEEVISLLDKFQIKDLFKVILYPGSTRLRKPDLEIFQMAIKLCSSDPSRCCMVGDRLDTDIAPANRMAMKTIRIKNSIFNCQFPLNEFESPSYTIDSLAELPMILNL